MPPLVRALRLKRARTILVYWKADRLILENYRTRIAISADPISVRLLHVLSEWRHPEQMLRELPEYSRESVGSALRLLVEHTLLVQEGTPDARQDARVAEVWSRWLPYGSFHFGTKDALYARGSRRTKLVQDRLAESRQPSFFKTYPKASRLALPPCIATRGEFLTVLLKRKTHREFSANGLSLYEVSQLLYYTWGIQDYRSSPYGRLAHKTSPSGGARHPVEVYLLALKVKGLAAGLYHYDCRRHLLELLHKGSMRHKAMAYCAGQPYVKDAAALFLMTAAFPRSMWKYRSPRAYRIVTLDAGHLCQTFCLTATFLGLAPFCTAALKDTLIEKDLGLDGITESVLYVAGVGLPAANETS
jgi:SagB-type dehydrogenase family enzyme